MITGKSVGHRIDRQRRPIPESLLARVRKLPGVADAAGAIFDLDSSSDKAQLIGRDGKAIAGTAARRPSASASTPTRRASTR